MHHGLHEPLPDDLGDATITRPKWLVDVWLALPTDAGLRALMLLRAPQHGGFWQGVSGGVESEDASLAHAALREILEETGLVLGARHLVDLEQTYVFTSPPSGRVFRKASLGAVLAPGLDVQTITLSEEHVELQVVTFDEARAMVRWPENRDELSALEARVT